LALQKISFRLNSSIKPSRRKPDKQREAVQISRVGKARAFTSRNGRSPPGYRRHRRGQHAGDGRRPRRSINQQIQNDGMGALTKN
jgi:hypothetical protein